MNHQSNIVSRVLFYISGHGFGHATRELAVMQELQACDPSAEIFVRTNAPRYVFEENLSRPIQFESVAIDTGTYQTDFIHLDKEKTYRAYKELMDARPSLIEREVRFIREAGIGLVVGDIPPAAFYIAHEAGVTSVAIANFSWDWIFEPYAQEYQQFDEIISDIRTGYALAGWLLRLPFAGDLSAFCNITDIPLVTRKPLFTPDRVRENLGLTAETRPVIICSFGGFRTGEFDLAGVMRSHPDYFFIGFAPEQSRGDNFLFLPYRYEIDHPSLVAFGDTVISKLGFSTVAECVGTGTPLMYISRDDFREYPVLEAGIQSLIPSYLIGRDDFFAGVWQPHLDTFVRNVSSHPKQVLCATDGATVAAGIISSELEKVK